MPKMRTFELEKLQELQGKTMQKQQDLVKYIENIDYESLEGSAKVAVDMNVFEEIAIYVSEMLILEKKKKTLICGLEVVPNALKDFSVKLLKLKTGLGEVKSKIQNQASSFKSDFKQISSILKEYKERCRNTLLYYLKTLDHDLRKILKPLVPSAVLTEQIKYPSINKNPSLLSSLGPSKNNSEKSIKPNIDKGKQGKVVVPEEKAISHVDLLVSTLEKVAKDLIVILSEANGQYYDAMNEKASQSHPHTPLAAPLPEYFVYETEESDIPLSNKIIIKEDAQMWIRRFNELSEKGLMSNDIFLALLEKVNFLKLKGRKIDLQDIYKELDISAELKENIAFGLVNKSLIQQHDVTLMDLLTVEENSNPPEKPKPEPPKIPNTHQKQRTYTIRNQKKSFEVENNDNLNVYASVDYQRDSDFRRQSPIPKYRLTSFREKLQKKPNLQEKNHENYIRVRSVTPVYVFKEKMSMISKSKGKGIKKINK